MHNTDTNAIKNWFGEEFYDLHPLLQKLHLMGGILSGNVRVSYGQGIAGLIGKRLAKKMNFPAAGLHELTVDISHHADGLHWYRRFGKRNQVKSLFKPVGNKSQGYFLETTGSVSMKLTVDIKNGGWYWRCISVSIFGLHLPLWLMPRLNAYKSIEGEAYHFHVDLSLPGMGVLVAYEGLLKADYRDEG